MKLFGWFRKKEEEVAEKRASLANPDPWMFEAFGADPSSSGESVNERTALGVSAYYAALRNISQDFGKLPVHAYRKQKNKSRERLDGSRIDRIMQNPNPEMTAMSFKEVMVGNALVHGNAYAEIQLDNANRPVALWPIPSRSVTPYRMSNGQLIYRVKQEQREVVLRPNQVFHLKGIGGDGIVGYSIIQEAKHSLGLGLAAQKSAGKFYANGARLSGVLQCPVALEDQARKNLKESWVAAYQGSGNAGKTPLLEEGIEFKAISISPEDAQFIEQQKFTVTEICRWFNIPPHKLMDLERATFSNIEHQAIAYQQDAIQPWAVRFEQEAKRKLISQSDVYIEVNIDALLRADTATRFEVYSKAIASGIRTMNEVRQLENLEPKEGGDELFANGGLMPISKLLADDPVMPPVAPAPDPEPQPEEDQQEPEEDSRSDLMANLVNAHVDVLSSAYSSLMTMEQDKASKAEKRGDLAEWADEFYSGHPDYVRARIGSSLEAHARTVWAVTKNGAMPQWAELAVQEAIVEASKRHAEASRESINNGIDPEDFSAERAEIFAADELRNINKLIEEMK
jgi:HK97 family phage portal protein